MDSKEHPLLFSAQPQQRGKMREKPLAVDAASRDKSLTAMMGEGYQVKLYGFVFMG